MWIFIINGLVITAIIAAIYFLYLYLKETGRKIAWWKWLLTIFWIIGTFIVIGFIGTAIGEGSPQAALRGGGFFLAIVLVSGILIFRFCLWQSGNRKSEE